MTFLAYLDSWESSVDSQDGFTPSQKNMMLSQETCDGLRMTGMSNLYYASLQY